MVEVNYLEDIATETRAELPPDLVPGEDAPTHFRLYALLLLVKGVAVDAEDVHNAWTVWMTARRPEHPALVPFAELTPDQRAADMPFVEAIRRVASLTRRGSEG